MSRSRCRAHSSRSRASIRRSSRRCWFRTRASSASLFFSSRWRARSRAASSRCLASCASSFAFRSLAASLRTAPGCSPTRCTLARPSLRTGFRKPWPHAHRQWGFAREYLVVQSALSFSDAGNDFAELFRLPDVRSSSRRARICSEAKHSACICPPAVQALEVHVVTTLGSSVRRIVSAPSPPAASRARCRTRHSGWVQLHTSSPEEGVAGNGCSVAAGAAVAVGVLAWLAADVDAPAVGARAACVCAADEKLTSGRGGRVGRTTRPFPRLAAAHCRDEKAPLRRPLRARARAERGAVRVVCARGFSLARAHNQPGQWFHQSCACALLHGIWPRTRYCTRCLAVQNIAHCQHSLT